MTCQHCGAEYDQRSGYGGVCTACFFAPADVIPLCPHCRLWGVGSCSLHQPKRARRIVAEPKQPLATRNDKRK